MEFQDIVRVRRSVKEYDSGYDITDEELTRLFNLVVLSPSSFNLQHWRFVVVRDAQQRQALMAAAMNQPQVGQASAAVVVCGKLNAYEDAAEIFADLPEEAREGLISMIHGFYDGKPEFQRDEAIRGASLAAMALMFAAKDLGYSTGPMIGFDPKAVSDLIGLDEHHIPVMMIALGKEAGEMRPRAARLPLDQVVKLETMDGAGL